MLSLVPMKSVYEFMLLIHPDVDLTEEKVQKEYVAKLLGDNVVISGLVSLGKKSLAYPIKKQNMATYLLADLSADAIKVGDIEKKTRLNDHILRYMLTVKDPVKSPKPKV